MSQIERSFEIDVKPNGAVVVNETPTQEVSGIPPIAGGSIEADLDLSTKGKQKRHQAVQETLRAIGNADLYADSVNFSRGSAFVIKK